MKQFLAACAVIALIPAAGGLQAAVIEGAAVAAPISVNATAVKSVSVVPASGRAEIVIGIDASVDVDDFVLEAPYRIVVDLKGAVISMAPRYDRLARGGVVNVRAAQFKPNVVRVVIEMDAAHTYEVARKDGEVRVTVVGAAGNFAAWHSSPELASRYASQQTVAAAAVAAPAPAMPATPAKAQSAPAYEQRPTVADAGFPSVTPDASISREYTEAAPAADQVLKLSSATALSDQPRITVTYQDADIRDVIAAFASFSGRTIVVGKDVAGTITAEIKNQPWDVALRAILQGQGLAAAEDALSGIITIDSYRNIASKQASEPLVTQMIAVNYASAASLVLTLQGLLARDCTQGGAQAQQNAQTNCYTRGAIAADTATNTLLITEAPSRMADLLSYVRNLDVRTPQVAIKAKIIFVNRTDIEELGLSYDLGTGNDQFFSQLVQRIDPSTSKPVDTNGDGVPDAFGGGSPFTGDRVLLGGSALAAIANANARVVNPALKLVFSAALGKFQLTSFLDALQEVRLADLQAEPSIVTLDNRRAEILVGQEIPIRVLDVGTQGQQGGGGAQGNNNVPRATVQLKEVGIILSVTPHITNNREILLKLHAENSDAQLASSDVGFIFGKQRADNQMLVKDGETAVIGGLTVTQVTSSKSGIPLLVDLPFIGRLFGTTRTSEQKRDLLILVTPHILDEGERQLAPRTGASTQLPGR